MNYQKILLKETCGAIFYVLTTFNQKEVPVYLRVLLNQSFHFDMDTQYNVILDGNKMILKNDKVTVEYLKGEEIGSSGLIGNVFF